MTYKDKCYCMRSSKHWCDERKLDYCDNAECYRHSSEIPKDLPPWELIAWSEFPQCDKKGFYFGNKS